MSSFSSYETFIVLNIVILYQYTRAFVQLHMWSGGIIIMASVNCCELLPLEIIQEKKKETK